MPPLSSTQGATADYQPIPTHAPIKIPSLRGTVHTTGLFLVTGVKYEGRGECTVKGSESEGRASRCPMLRDV
jgi:hypothetical protein